MADSNILAIKENTSDIDEDCVKYEPSSNTPIDVNTWISSFMTEIELAEYFNDDLLDVFKEEFVNFNAAQFKRCSDIILRKLKNFLFDRGVFIRKANVSHIKALTELMEKDINVWPTNIANPSAYIGSLKTNDFKSPRITESQQKVQNYFNKNNINDSNVGGEIYTGKVKSTSEPKINLNFKLTGMSKLYNESEKYSGGKDDSYNFKLNIFLKKCELASIENEKDILSSMFLMFNKEALDFYHHRCSNAIQIDEISQLMLGQFEGPQKQRNAQNEWNKITLQLLSSQHSEKPLLDVFEILVKQLRNLQLCLRPNFQDETTLRDKILQSVSNIPECRPACLMPEQSLNTVINNIRGAIGMTTSYEPKPDETLFVNRRFHIKDKSNEFRNKQSQNNSERLKRCYCCKKVGCRSWRHTDEEQRQARQNFLKRHNNQEKIYYQFLAEYEGESENDEEEAMILHDITLKDMDEADGGFFITTHDDENNYENINNFMTSATEIENCNISMEKTILSKLQDSSILHMLTKTIPQVFKTKDDNRERYDETKWHGVVINTGAGKYSTAGYRQYIAYIKEFGQIALKTSTKISVVFGKGSTCRSLGFVTINSPIGMIDFHIVNVDTPFLLSIADMKHLGVYLNNLDDKLYIRKTQSNCNSKLTNHNNELTFPVTMKFGHPFLIWNKYLISSSNNISTANENRFKTDEIFLSVDMQLTEQQIRRLHRRFGHASVSKLSNLLDRAGYTDFRSSLQDIVKHCELCQKYGPAPQRFKFSLRNDNCCFNHTIFADILFIDNKPVLHIVDEATRFQAARFLKGQSSQNIWDALRQSWIDVYVGPPDLIVHDAGSNFTSKEMHQFAQSMGAGTKCVPVEAHHSIGIVERYHQPLRRAYKIIQEELKSQSIDNPAILQMAVKAVNDTAGPDGITPTVLVFGMYPKITEAHSSNLSIVKRANAIQKASIEIAKLRAKRDVNRALNLRNGPNIAPIHNVPLGGKIWVWRETGKWTGPYTLLELRGEDCIVNLPSGPTKFRSTSCKPHYPEEETNAPFNNCDSNSNDFKNDNDDINNSNKNDNINDTLNENSNNNNDGNSNDNDYNINNISSNIRRNARRNTRIPMRYTQFLTFPGISTPTSVSISDYHMSKNKNFKHIDFSESRKLEIQGLIEKGVFKIVNKSEVGCNRLFGSKFVDSIKNESTSKAYKKSRMVVQGYNDIEKHTILTQAPTIQRVSQRIILCLSLILEQKLQLLLRDISQAYVQSTTLLHRKIYVKAPPELGLDENHVLLVLKPLYGISEAGNHWYHTYHKHIENNLNMEASTFDSCLLISAPARNDKDGFGIIGLQTDDTLILCDEKFALQEEKQRQKANFKAKPVEFLTKTNSIKFNGSNISKNNDGSLMLTQELHCNKIKPINNKSDIKPQYISQRALGAYIATVCQPEASFDLSRAAQTVSPGINEAALLNKRLKWQKINSTRGLKFVKLDNKSLKIIVFTDGSFANNKEDMTSQIGYVICLADNKNRANILHWSSTKCKRITRSVLASELYAMVVGFDMATVIKSALEKVIKSLSTSKLSPSIPLILCTDSRSLYECLSKLGTTTEKRLMIDIMALRQSYDYNEVAEIRWIEGLKNPADAMTKHKPCDALKKLIDKNEVDISANSWMENDLENTKDLD